MSAVKRTLVFAHSLKNPVPMYVTDETSSNEGCGFQSMALLSFNKNNIKVNNIVACNLAQRLDIQQRWNNNVKKKKAFFMSTEKSSFLSSSWRRSSKGFACGRTFWRHPSSFTNMKGNQSDCDDVLHVLRVHSFPPLIDFFIFCWWFNAVWNALKNPIPWN